ncbi:hypothetical protein ACFY1G_33115 [Streptomyces olivaceus]|uniref:hypothetical protein n=1 Tax=Streptomyces olivaceus TaxID=47716 RepID=UPI0022EEFC2E|nr:hypothetical protein [Streptomyces olivaceus]GHI99345.1 hypothetical protein TPA0906_12110 [Streptomyces olivaceus]
MSVSALSSDRQIENLIVRYSHLGDEGNLAEFGALFDEADFVFGELTLRGGPLRT